MVIYTVTIDIVEIMFPRVTNEIWILEIYDKASTYIKIYSNKLKSGYILDHIHRTYIEQALLLLKIEMHVWAELSQIIYIFHLSFHLVSPLNALGAETRISLCSHWIT